MGEITTQSLDKKRKLVDKTKTAFSSANIVPSNKEFKPEHVDEFLKKRGYVENNKIKKVSKKEVE